MIINNRQKIVVSIIAIAVIGLGVYKWTHRTHLPSERPADLVIEWQEGGGMDPTGSSVTIREGKGARKFTNWVDGQTVNSIVNFTPTSADLDALYATIRSNAFDTIQESKEEIYDGNNDSVRISWGENDIDIWGITVIASDQNRFNHVYEAIQTYVNTHAVSVTK